MAALFLWAALSPPASMASLRDEGGKGDSGVSPAGLMI